MFGHNDEDKTDDNQQPTDDQTTAPDLGQTSSVSNSDNSEPVGGAPAFDTSSVSLPAQDDSAPDDNDSPSLPDPVPTTPHDDEPLLTTGVSDDLISIKQDALHQLSPLVGHLDQTPEEKFKTTMMMIQASDDQSLVKTAFEAAKQIPDDKVRAQALLDIINEINYFTQQAK